MATPIPANRARFSIEEVVAVTGGVLDASGTAMPSDIGTATTSVVIDSRAVTQGALFVALRGDTHDGHRFVEAAVSAGTRAVVAASDAAIGTLTVPVVRVDDTLIALGDLAAAHRKRWGGTVVAITGSAGKTSTKELTHAALEATTGGRVQKTEGNLNNLVGVPMTLFTLNEDVSMAVIEMGTSVAGEIARLGEIGQPDIAVITLVSAAHTEGLGDIDAVAEEKASLLGALRPMGVAVMNADDETLARASARFGYGEASLDSDRAAAHRQVLFGTAAHADVRVVSHAFDDELRTVVVYDVRGGSQRIEARLELLGEAAAWNGAAALAVAFARGDDLSVAARGLSLVAPTPGRMCPRVGNGLRVLDDTYNANPRSTALALDTATELARATRAPLVVVLGDMKELGARSAADHASIAEHAVLSGARAVLLVGPEMALAAPAARARASSAVEVVHVDTTDAAVAAARTLVAPGDLVLVKGSRSMRTERVVDALLAKEVAR